MIELGTSESLKAKKKTRAEIPKNLEPMLKPKSVAIIGASRVPGKVGNVILQNYLSAGYSGELYPVNKNADEVLGIRAYRSILDIKQQIDLAVIAIPALGVPEVLEECGKKKVKSAIVVSGGFAEVGEIVLQEKIIEIAKKHNIAMLGPNCLGVMDTRSRVDTLFLPSYKISKPQIGGVSFVSQSGAIGSTVLDVVSGEGFGLSKFISYGNAAYIDEVDILNYLMHDDETKVIVLYIEGIKRGKEFVEIARKITKVKPVVVLKAGRTSAGSSAAHSHTAALAGNYEVYEAIFRQFGFTIAEDISDMIYYAKIFDAEIEPKGNRIAVVTNGGGLGVITADDIGSSRYLKMSAFSVETRRALKSAMPGIVNIANPLDLAGDADDKRYESALTAIGKDAETDMILAIVLFQTPGADSKVAAELIKLKDSLEKPMVVISIGAEYTEMHKKMMESAGLPVYDSPEAAVKSFEALLRYAEYRSRFEK